MKSMKFTQQQFHPHERVTITSTVPSNYCNSSCSLVSSNKTTLHAS